MTQEQFDQLSDILDDHVRGYLLPKIMYAMAQDGDPINDFLDRDDEIEAYELLDKIGKALGLEAKRHG